MRPGRKPGWFEGEWVLQKLWFRNLSVQRVFDSSLVKEKAFTRRTGKTVGCIMLAAILSKVFTRRDT
jgi:hypothetical protein